MATRLEKLDKIKLPPSNKPEQSAGVPPVTQTIIINNPNININYMNDSARTNGPMSSRGLDNWNLNNNLKEFSQTRQLGFFKTRKERNKSNSPYIIHKVRTQDLRSINKIYAPSMKETNSNFRKNETISHIQPKETEDVKEISQNSFDKVIGKSDKTITEKFYQGQIKKNLRIDLQKNFETLPTNNLSNPQNTLDPPRVPKSFRKGRFEMPSETIILPISYPREPSKESTDSLTSPEKCVKMDDKDERQAESADSDSKPSRKIAPRMYPLELRKRAFTKTIANIDKLLLSSTDNYFQRSYGQKLPQSQIELCVNSMNHPQKVAPSRDRSSQREFNTCREYDFLFEEEKKKRPKTPRKKKFYNPQEG